MDDQLAIDQEDQSIDLTETEVEPNGRESKLEFRCSPGRKECPLDVNGRRGKVTLWYHGPMLVDLQTKRRMKLSEDGQRL